MFRIILSRWFLFYKRHIYKLIDNKKAGNLIFPTSPCVLQYPITCMLYFEKENIASNTAFNYRLIQGFIDFEAKYKQFIGFKFFSSIKTFQGLVFDELKTCRCHKKYFCTSIFYTHHIAIVSISKIAWYDKKEEDVRSLLRQREQ